MLRSVEGLHDPLSLILDEDGSAVDRLPTNPPVDSTMIVPDEVPTLFVMAFDSLHQVDELTTSHLAKYGVAYFGFVGYRFKGDALTAFNSRAHGISVRPANDSFPTK